MDVLMIVAGYTYLSMQYFAAQALRDYTLQEVWFVAQEKQIAEVFGSITIVLAFFRILDYLTLWDFLGILIISIFKMMTDIVRFLFIFVLVVIGFSSAFHISYTGYGIDTWNEFVKGSLTTFLSSPTGYDIPDYGNNVLGFAGMTFGLVSQVIYVFVGIILLLNLLVALLWETYAAMSLKASVEYRWHVTQPFKTSFSFLWPSPFTTLHVFLIFCTTALYSIGKCCGHDITKKYSAYKRAREELGSGLPTNHQLLMSGMVIHFLKVDLGDKYKDYLIVDTKVFNNSKSFSKGKGHD